MTYKLDTKKMKYRIAGKFNGYQIWRFAFKMHITNIDGF